MTNSELTEPGPDVDRVMHGLPFVVCHFCLAGKSFDGRGGKQSLLGLDVFQGVPRRGLT